MEEVVLKTLLEEQYSSTGHNRLRRGISESERNRETCSRVCGEGSLECLD